MHTHPPTHTQLHTQTDIHTHSIGLEQMDKVGRMWPEEWCMTRTAVLSSLHSRYTSSVTVHRQWGKVSKQDTSANNDGLLCRQKKKTYCIFQKNKWRCKKDSKSLSLSSLALYRNCSISSPHQYKDITEMQTIFYALWSTSGMDLEIWHKMKTSPSLWSLHLVHFGDRLWSETQMWLQPLKVHYSPDSTCSCLCLSTSLSLLQLTMCGGGFKATPTPQRRNSWNTQRLRITMWEWLSS